MHFPRLSPIAISVSLFFAFQTRAEAFGEEILWPIGGLFPAYPAEQVGTNFDFLTQAGITYDSNILRLPDGVNPAPSVSSERSEKIVYAGVGVDLKKQLSQQVFTLKGRVDHNWYDQLRFLNHTAHRGELAWLWAAGNSLTGELGYTNARQLSDFGDLRTPIKDLLGYQYSHFLAAWKFLQNWRVRGLAEDTRYNHSSAALKIIDNYTTKGTVGLDFVTSSDSTIGFQYAEARGNYPNRVSAAGRPANGKYKDHESSGALDWKISRDSELLARVGYTKREHDDPTIPEFKGGTGRVDLRMSPSAKVIFNWSLYREVQSVEDVAASYVTAKGISFAPAWAISLKTILQATLFYENRDIQGILGTTTAVPTAAHREDITRAARLSFGYSPIDSVRLTLRAEHGNRSSTDRLLSYDYNMASFEAQARF